MKKYQWIPLGLAVVLALSTGCSNNDEPAVASEIEISEPTTVEAYGTVKIKNSYHVSLEVPARVTQVQVHSGQAVKKGDLLFTIDIEEMLTELENKKMSLALAQEELNLLGDPTDDTLSLSEEATKKALEASTLEKNTLYNQYKTLKTAIADGSNEDIQMALTSMNNAENQLNAALSTLTKKQQLITEGIVTQEDLNLAQQAYDNALSTYDTAKLTYSLTVREKEEERDTLLKSYRLAESQLSNLESQEGQSGHEYNTKLLEVKELEQSLTTLEKHLNQPYLKDSGQVICHLDQAIVDDFDLTAGDYITGDGSTPLFTLHDSSQLEVRTKVSEDFIKDLHIGQSAQIIPIASRDKIYNGTITSIADIAYEDGGEAVIPVLVSITDDDGFLKANYNVDVSFLIE